MVARSDKNVTDTRRISDVKSHKQPDALVLKLRILLTQYVSEAKTEQRSMTHLRFGLVFRVKQRMGNFKTNASGCD